MSITRTIPGSAVGRLSIVSGGWASLSNSIIFVAKHSPVDMSYKPNVANFVQQDLLQGKPRLQKLGINLQEIKISCKFHFMILPYKELVKKLNEAAYNGTVLQWIWGTGEVLGDFVIKGWEEKPIKTDEAGLIFATNIELTLLEYAGPGIAEQTGIDAKKAAFANKQRDNLNANLPTMKATSVQSLSKNVQVVKVENVKIQKKLNLLQRGRMSMAAFKRDVLPAVHKVQRSVLAINSAVAIARNIKNAGGVTAAASLVGVAVGSLGSAVGGSPTLDTISGLCNDVSLASGGLDTASQSHQIVKSWFPSLGL